MLVTPAKWQKLKEDRDHEAVMRKDREAFQAFQRSQYNYQRKRTFYIACFLAMAVVTLVCVIRLAGY